MTISGTLLGTALLPATPPFTTGNYSPPGDSEPAGLQQLRRRRRPPHERPDAEWPYGGFRLAVEPRVCS